MLQSILANPVFLIVALLAAFFIGLSKGGLPVIAMLSVPMMALFISPVTAAAMLLPIYIASDMFGLWLYRGSFSRRNLAILIPSALAGVGVGWATATLIPEWTIALIIGLMGILFCAKQWFRPNAIKKARPADVPRGIFWGMLAGFTSFVSHSGGPPFQMYVLPQKLKKLVFAGTSTILFAVVNIGKLIPYWQLGQFRADNLTAAFALIPIAVIGTYVGAWLTKVVREDIFFRAVEIALLLVSLQLIYEAVLMMQA